ncbi:MAG: helix-turn-helix transcriptional regulator [Propionibacteriaceae bacterium]|nr:helix-turn-helix transcriptional regulator [Propionibacteriaceae bacterium]
MNECRERSGLGVRQFARVLGTSASRLSTYVNGKVSPSAALLVRAEAIAAEGPVLRRTRAIDVAKAGRAMRRAADDGTRLRIFLEFMRGADESGYFALALLEPAPKGTGDVRFDALLAAGVEHIAARHSRSAPKWATDPSRTLSDPWWVSDLPSAKAQALQWTPASFLARGIFLDRRDLESR